MLGLFCECVHICFDNSTAIMGHFKPVFGYFNLQNIYYGVLSQYQAYLGVVGNAEAT